MSALYMALLVVEVVLALGVILLVLLHAPKGDGLGGIGGSATLFSGKRGAEGGLDRVTWTLVGAFMVICVILGYGFVTP